MMDINKLRSLAQAATPGPWFSDDRGNIWRRPPSDLYENGGSVAGDKPIAFVAVGWVGEGVTGYPVEDNAALIAAVNPAVIIELLDRLERAEKERDDLRAKIETSVPEGWKLVPTNATLEMRAAGLENWQYGDKSISSIWDDMIAAAPKLEE